MAQKIEIRCKKHNCNQLLMNYFATGENVKLCLQGIELKCEKCGRVFRLKEYTENALISHSDKGVFYV